MFKKLIFTDFKNLLKLSLVLDSIKKKAKRMYGNQETKLPIFFLLLFFNFIFISPSQCLGHFELSSNSQISFGTKKLHLTANVTIAIPNNPPKIEGNSGPRKIAVIK